MRKPGFDWLHTRVQDHPSVKLPPNSESAGTFAHAPRPWTGEARTTIPVELCGSLARVGSKAAAGRWLPRLRQRLGAGRAAERMADGDISDNEPTTRTLLRGVLDTEAPRTPRRRQSTRAGYVSAARHRSRRRTWRVWCGADTVCRRERSRLRELRSPGLGEPVPLPYLGLGPLCAPHPSGLQAAESSAVPALGAVRPGEGRMGARKPAPCPVLQASPSPTRPERPGVRPTLLPGRSRAEGRRGPGRVLC